MYVLKGKTSRLFRALKLEVKEGSPLRGYLIAGVSGTLLHVLLDYPLYSDIKPFYPLEYNPLYNPGLTADIYMFCTITAIIGLIGYLLVIIESLSR